MKTKLIILALIMSVSMFSQITEKVFYDYAKTQIKFIYQTNASHIKNGSYKAFGKKGNLVEEGIYKLGKKSGAWKQFDDYGKPFSIMNYVDDKIHGVYKQWCFEDGKTVSYLCGDYIYNMGKEEKAIQYWPNGNKSKNVVKDGVCNEWFENGNKKSEWTNKDGISSAMTYFLENGKPEAEIINGKTYKYDNYHSEFGFDSYGSLMSLNFDSAGYHYSYKYSYSKDYSYKILTITNLTDKEIYKIKNYNKNDINGIWDKIKYFDNGFYITCLFNTPQNYFSGNNINPNEYYITSISQTYSDSLYKIKEAKYGNTTTKYDEQLIWNFDKEGMFNIGNSYGKDQFDKIKFNSKEEFDNDPRVKRGKELHEINSK